MCGMGNEIGGYTCFHVFIKIFWFIGVGFCEVLLSFLSRCQPNLFVEWYWWLSDMCQCTHMCTYIYVSAHICTYKYNIGMNMYTCVYMYIHIRQNKYMYIMIQTYVYTYTCGFSVCVWVGERICVSKWYSHKYLLTQKRWWKSCENMTSGSQQ